MNEGTKRALACISVHKRLYDLWGPEERWPVPWQDIVPSIDLWLRDGFSDDSMVKFILECVEEINKR